jgi:hypothetical protein
MSAAPTPAAGSHVPYMRERAAAECAAALRTLRDYGHAVAVIEPHERGLEDPRLLEQTMRIAGLMALATARSTARFKGG